MTDAISVLLVDDHAEFRQGLRTLLGLYTNGQAAFNVVAEAASAEQAIEMLEVYKPMLVLLDMELADGTGLEVLQRLKTLGVNTRVLGLSAHRNDTWIFQAMQAGAQGYITKDKLATQLYEALCTVLQDEIYLDSQLTSGFFRLFHANNGSRTVHGRKDIKLTEREREVLYWLVQGASNEAIAKELYITVATVKAHLTAVFEKLKVRSRTQAIVKALKLGLVDT
ncbi:MAG: response regulator transcription factor [Cyanobacteria bacterium P01_D01_bin.156]